MKVTRERRVATVGPYAQGYDPRPVVDVRRQDRLSRWRVDLDDGGRAWGPTVADAILRAMRMGGVEPDMSAAIDEFVNSLMRTTGIPRAFILGNGPAGLQAGIPSRTMKVTVRS